LFGIYNGGGIAQVWKMPFRDWELSGEEWRVVVRAPAVQDLRRLSIEGFVALPRRGMEVGGILFGKVHAGEIRIEGFEEVDCEHKYGPSYALSKSDRTQLNELLEARRGGRLPVLGFFRSFTSRDPVIEEADEAFVREHFPEGEFLFLLLQPLSAENCVASCRLFRDGQLLPEAADAPTAPFDAKPAAPVVKEIRAPKHRPHEEEVEEEEEEVIEAQTKTETPATVRVERPILIAKPEPKPTRWWIPALIALGCIACVSAVYPMWTLAREPRWTELHLNAQNANGQLEVSWDGNAAQSVRAARGLLAVTEGDAYRDVQLGPSEIRAGKYTIPVTHSEIGLRLILYSNGLGVAGDSMRLTTMPSPVVAPPQTPVAIEARTEVARTEPARPPHPIVPPAIVHEVQPRIPEGIRARISEKIVIPVNVEVSEKGRVVRALADAQTGDGIHRYLAELAQRTAREWRFAPARSQSGERVAASKMIDFVFTP
jgi:hypothetical protein